MRMCGRDHNTTLNGARARVQFFATAGKICRAPGEGSVTDGVPPPADGTAYTTARTATRRARKNSAVEVVCYHPRSSGVSIYTAKQAGTAQLPRIHCICNPAKTPKIIYTATAGRIVGRGYNLWQSSLNPQNRIGVAIPRNQTKLVSSP